MLALEKARQLFHQGDLPAAIDSLQRALQREPNNPHALHLMSLLLSRSDHADRAIYFADKAAVAAPASPGFLIPLASLFHTLAQTDKALAAADRAAAINPPSAATLIDLTALYWRMGQLARAIDSGERAMRLNPAAARGLFTSILTHVGEVGRAIEILRAELAKNPADRALLMGLVQALNYWPRTDPQEVLDLHRRLGATFAPLTRPAYSYPGTRDPDRRLRLGLISPDFYIQSAAYFVEPILRHLDRGGFEVFCYSSHPHPDAMTQHLRSLADHWHDISRLPPAHIVNRLDQDRLDILIDLAGLTTGNVLEVMAARPAPVQVTAIGYPNTTGLLQIDYRLVDAITDAEGSLAVETLHRLPGCFLCYQPPTDAPLPAPRDHSTPLTFGSFNTVHKMSPPVIQTWTRILHSTPGSRLLLKASQFFSPDIRARFASRFAAAGLEPQRLELLPPIPSAADHLALYHKIDIALDPFPYNGTTTSCEALYMGVPVITLRGSVHASRVGASLLTAVGLPEFITPSTDEYANSAASLAADPARRADFRANLRTRMLASPLCDGPAYASKLSAALRQMWRKYCSPST